MLSTMRSSNWMSSFSAATSRATRSHRPSAELHDVRLVHGRDLLPAVLPGVVERELEDAPCAGDRDRLDRDARVRVAKRAALRRDPADQLLCIRRALLVLDARIEILGVLPDDDQVDVLEARPDAGVALARPHLRVHVELLAQGDVHRAEAAADRGRDRALERDSGLTDRLEHLGRQWIAAVLVHHVRARFANVPVEVDARRLEHAARGFGQLGPGAVAGDEDDVVRHGLNLHTQRVESPSDRTRAFPAGRRACCGLRRDARPASDPRGGRRRVAHAGARRSAAGERRRSRGCRRVARRGRRAGARRHSVGPLLRVRHRRGARWRSRRTGSPRPGTRTPASTSPRPRWRCWRRSAGRGSRTLSSDSRWTRRSASSPADRWRTSPASRRRDMRCWPGPAGTSPQRARTARRRAPRRRWRRASTSRCCAPPLPRPRRGAVDPVAGRRPGSDGSDGASGGARRVHGTDDVCVQAGNVNTGAVDSLDGPLDRPGPRPGAWLHVDGAFGLWGAVSPERAASSTGSRARTAGPSDCHKWLNVPYDSGLAICAHPEALRLAVGDLGRYLVHAEDKRERDEVDCMPSSARRGRGTPSTRRSARSAAAASRRWWTAAARWRAASPSSSSRRRARPERRGAQPGAGALRRRRADARCDRGGAGRGDVLARRYRVARRARDADLRLELAHDRQRRRPLGPGDPRRRRVGRARGRGRA